jgi:5'-3' exonuclease
MITGFLFSLVKKSQMGIKGLNQFLKQYSPDAFVDLPKSYFRGKRIAIDSDQILRKLMSRAHKEIVDKTDVVVNDPDRDEIIKRWLFHLKHLLLDLLKIGATPIFIFDGQAVPEKSETREKRKEVKLKAIRKAEEEKEKILQIDVLERTPQMVTSLRKKMHHLGYLSSDEKDICMDILSGLGIPVLRATGEGEKLCAMLCIEGKVDAGYSKDTDFIALGCPLTINEPGNYIYNPQTHRMEESFKCTLFKPILSALEIEYKTFLDLCIMGGCDFNKNIFRVGLKRSYPILKACKTIDQLPNKYHDKMECLNHLKCRNIFLHVPSHQICQDDIVLNINTDLTNARDRLEMHGVEDWIKEVSPLYKRLPTPSNNFILNYPSLNKSRLKLNIGLHGMVPSHNLNDNDLDDTNTGDTLDNEIENLVLKHKSMTVSQLNKRLVNSVLKKYPSLLDDE